ncbi:MAG: DNA polymerase III subunit gamma/tau, partial [Abditibacteriales bacterium]|nr:DNA polymerase III subunit gamma/tau [Abditibacteriales bacterium]MDW8368465.1 DNA polymerase III subunit gamma/tau [Abditibacteriales bacterium]
MPNAEFQSLYRKYRPQTFEEVVGQEHVTRTLQNTLRAHHLAHAYLFCGPRGTGKTTCARLLAKALNCEQGPTDTPCCQCDFCVRVQNNQALLDLIEIDAASHTGVDNVRDVIVDRAGFAPAEGRYKVYIIDEVHMLSTSAFNALLKTLEEPPKHVVFVLATTDVHRVPPTIISRCQRFDFKRVTAKDIVERLRCVAQQEKIKVDDAALMAIARAADGAMRDALGLLEQLAAFGGDAVTEAEVHAVLGTVARDWLLDITDALARRDTAGALALLHNAINDGKSVPHLVHSLCDHFRDLLLLSVGYASDTVLSSAEQQRYTDQATALGRTRIMQIIDSLCQAEKDMKWNPEHRLVAEIALFKATMDWQAVPPVAQAASPPPPPARPPHITTPSEPPTVTTPSEPEPSVQPVASAFVSSSDDLRDRWSDILQRLKRKIGVSNCALLQEAEPEREGQTIVLKFTKQFHYDRVRDESRRRVVEEALSEFFGERCAVRCEMMDAGERRPPITETLPSKREDR